MESFTEEKDKEGIIDFLKRVDLFHSFSEAEIKGIADQVEVVSFSRGQMIIKQGEVAENLYILASGVAEGIYRNKHNLKSHIFRFRRRDYFPLKSLLTHRPSQISFQAMKPTKVYILPGTLLSDLFFLHASMRKAVLNKIFERADVFAKSLFENRKWQHSLKSLMKTVEEDATFLVGKTEAMQKIWQRIPELAVSHDPILIKGEFGVGKELIAEIIHCKGPSKDRPFIIIDAFDISEKDWAENISEDDPERITKITFGPFASLGGVTILLKNIDALTPVLQGGLKEYLLAEMNKEIKEDRFFKKISTAAQAEGIEYLTRIKLVLTTRRELTELVNSGKFDPELYNMISKNFIYIPPLRERKIDILELLHHFLAKYSTIYNKNVNRLSRRARELLLGYNYPRGNIQELEEIINRGVALTDTDSVRSEHLFLGNPAGKANVLYNFLKIKTFDRMVKKGIYPGLFKGIIVMFFLFIMFLCFFGSQNPEKNLGTILVWWIWWPWLCIAAFWIGRTWCSLCAYATVGHIVQKRFNLRLRFPKFLKDYDYLIAIFIFLFIVWVEETSKMRKIPKYTGLLLLSILTIEVLFSILFQRDIWCRHVCPMGNLIGIFAMSSIVEVRSNLDICINQCTTNECYHGTKDLPGCPMFQHLRFVDNNQTCKLCLNCIRVCPHKAVSLNLRYPGWEIWESNQVRSGMAFFVLTLMAVLLPVINPFRSSLLNALALLLTPALMICLIWLISLLSFYRRKGEIYEGFWRTTYAYVPLALATHIAYQTRYLPWLKDINYNLFIKTETLIGGSSLIYLVQAVLLFIGLLFSFYALIRVARKNFSKEKSPAMIYWPGHIMTMIIYSILIWHLLI